MDELSTTTGIVALAAGGVALLALILAAVLAVRVRRLRRDQRVVLGGSGREDLTAHAAELQRAFEDLHDRVGEAVTRLGGRMGELENRLDGAIAFRALVRYDAYNELAGRQSMTIALLDAERNGIVLSSIAHRDTARLYCKQVVGGRGELELSPEEAEAVKLALAGEQGSRVLG